MEKIPLYLVQHSFPPQFYELYSLHSYCSVKKTKSWLGIVQGSLRPLLCSEDCVLSATPFHCSRYQAFNFSPPLSTNIVFNPQCLPVLMIRSKSWSVFISCLQFALCLDFLSQFPLALSCGFATPELGQLTFCFPVFVHKSAERSVFKQLSSGSFSAHH